MAINIMEAFQQEPPQLDDIHALWINRIQDWLEPHQSQIYRVSVQKKSPRYTLWLASGKILTIHVVVISSLPE
uniref:hypothetical protein n=1 Tax=Salmonella enterica TaxID=28901 RepID=UPI00155D87C7|nr:hypothetical protein [Salmonella enterica]